MNRLIIITVLLGTLLNSAFSQIEVKCDNFTQIIDSNLILVQKGSMYGVIDLSGNLIIDYILQEPVISDNIIIYSKGLGDKRETNFIDLTSKEIIYNKQIPSFHKFNEGLAHIDTWNVNESSFFINKQGNKQFSLPMNTKHSKVGVNYLFSEGLVVIPINDYNSTPKEYFVYFDKKGKQVINTKYSYAKDFKNGLAKVGEYKNGIVYWGFIDKNDSLVIEYKYSQEPTSFSDGLSRVETKNGKYGFINLSGEIVLPTQYSFATGFYKGMAIVKKTDEKSLILINKKGETLKQYNSIVRFNRVEKSDQSITIIKELIDERIVSTGSSYASIITIDDKIIFNKKGLSIKSFKNGLIIFEQNDFTTGESVKGVMSLKKEVLLTIKKDQF